MDPGEGHEVVEKVAPADLEFFVTAVVAQDNVTKVERLDLAFHHFEFHVLVAKVHVIDSTSNL